MFEIIFGVLAALAALFCGTVGVMALIGGSRQNRRCSAAASGTVSAVHAQTQEKGKRRVTIYTPEFRFEADGRTYTMRAHFGSMKRDFQEGQAVTIRYDPADPKTAFVADDRNNSSMGGVMMICFGVLLAMGAITLFT